MSGRAGSRWRDIYSSTVEAYDLAIDAAVWRVVEEEIEAAAPPPFPREMASRDEKLSIRSEGLLMSPWLPGWLALWGFSLLVYGLLLKAGL